MANGEDGGRPPSRSRRRAVSAAEAGHEPADGRLQLALVEEADGWLEDAEEEEDRQAAGWSDTRELQDLFLVARPTWTLPTVDKSVSKLQKVGITSLLELKEALDAGEVNARLGRANFPTFSRATLRELKTGINEGSIPRRENLAILEKRLDRADNKFRRRMEKFVENALDERGLDSEERLRKIVDQHVDEQLRGDFDSLYERFYTRLKKNLGADFQDLERSVNRHFEEFSRRLDDLVEPDRGQRRETGSSWPSGLSSAAAPNQRSVVAIAGPGQLMPTSPRRRPAKGEAKEVAEGRAGAPEQRGQQAQEEGGGRAAEEDGERDRQGQDLERRLQESEARRAALEAERNRVLERLEELEHAAEEERRSRQLIASERESLRHKAVQHRLALGSDASSADEQVDDSASEPPSSRDACQQTFWKTAELKTELAAITAMKTELLTELTASIKEVLHEELQEGFSKQQAEPEQDELTMWYMKGGPNETQLPMASENGSEASYTMQTREDVGTFYEQPTTELITGREKPRLGLIRELTSVGAEWECIWSEVYQSRIYKNKKTHEISFIMPDMLPENYSDEPEVVVSTPRPALAMQEPETPEETPSEVSEQTSDGPKRGSGTSRSFLVNRLSSLLSLN